MVASLPRSGVADVGVAVDERAGGHVGVGVKVARVACRAVAAVAVVAAREEVGVGGVLAEGDAFATDVAGVALGVVTVGCPT